MQTLIYSLRYLLKKRGNSFTRMLSLALGMIIALLVFSYVGLNLSFNSFFPDKERVYQVWRNSPKIGGMAEKQVMPFAPNLVADIPQIEAAAHFIEVTKLFGVTGDIREAKALQTNSTLFNVLDFGVISGNAERILSAEGAAAGEIMISERLAKKEFGNDDPLGKKLGLMVVAGVFETPPVNQSIGDFDILEHLPYDKDNEVWTGGDSYSTFIKLREGVDISEVEALMPAFIEKHGLKEYCKEWQMTFHFVPLTSTTYVANDVQQMQFVYSAIALVALVVACLNYVLLTISSLAERSRTIATLKCNGASRRGIFCMLLSETLILFAAATLLAVAIIASLHNEIHNLLGYTVSDLFAFERIWVPALVCLAGFLVASILPSALFSAVNINYAFRRGGDNRAWWKKFLLFLQISATVAAVLFLLVSNRQVSHLANSDYGYRFDRLMSAELSVRINDAGLVADKLRTLPFVENAAMSTSSPLSGYSGMPCVDEQGNLLFSCRWEIADHNYIPTMQMNIVNGRNFLPDDAANKVIVNEKYVEMRGWNDSPIGKIIYDSSMVPFEIVGVITDYRMMSTGVTEPLVLHPLSYAKYLVGENAPDDYKNVVLYNVLLNELNSGNIQELDRTLASICDRNSTYSLLYYGDWIDFVFANVRQMRNGMLVVALVVLVISFIGLCGYLQGEMARRRKEIAVRKVCGASTAEVLVVLGTRLLRVVLPAVVCGVALALWGSSNYLSTLSHMRCTVPVWLYIAGVSAVIALVYAVQLLLTWRAANANPAETIKKNN